MEIRAREDTPMPNDLTPSIPPIAASLHDKFLHSHCSSCFLPLPSSSSSSTSLHPTSTNPLLSCSSCSASVQYCSPECAADDSDRHFSAGECRLFILRPSSPAEDTADVRAALRLIHLFERLGLLPSPSPLRVSPRRIGGLLASGLVEVMGEGSELAERIREGGMLMARARNPRMIVGGCMMDKVSIEEEVLWAVMTNAVEVEVGELGGIGVAVYGPWFSWFNHSCAPNACYRFELSSGFEASRPCDLGPFKVLPAGGAGEALDVWKTWNYIESSLAHGLCWFGPRIIIRNIKPLKKDDEVCVAYMDLLQPKPSLFAQTKTKKPPPKKTKRSAFPFTFPAVAAPLLVEAAEEVEAEVAAVAAEEVEAAALCLVEVEAAERLKSRSLLLKLLFEVE